MYVVLSGQCQVRARPMHAAASEQQPQAAPETAVTAEQSSSSTDSSDSDNDVAAVEMSRQAAARRSEGEHPATYWIHKYMEQVRTKALSYLRCLSTVMTCCKPMLSPHNFGQLWFGKGQTGAWRVQAKLLQYHAVVVHIRITRVMSSHGTAIQSPVKAA